MPHPASHSSLAGLRCRSRSIPLSVPDAHRPAGRRSVLPPAAHASVQVEQQSQLARRSQHQQHQPPQKLQRPQQWKLQQQCSTRRSAVLAATAAASCSSILQLLAARHAQATLVDEIVAQSVFALASRTVVSINDVRLRGGSELLEGVGTGIIWDSYGHVVTNYHCISKYVLNKTGQQAVRIVFDDGSGSSSPYPATVKATDAAHDLAVLQVDAPAELLVPVRMGTSSNLKVGQSVYAVGNPYNLIKTLSVGVVSGLNRTIPAPTGTRIYGAIQTDASISADNSGGPLLDSFGRLVGVSTATFTRKDSGRGSGVNFALPSDLVRSIVPNLIVYGTAAGRGVRAG